MSPWRTKVVHRWPSHSNAILIHTILSNQLLECRYLLIIFWCLIFHQRFCAVYDPRSDYNSDSTSHTGRRHSHPLSTLNWPLITQEIPHSFHLPSSGRSSLGFGLSRSNPFIDSTSSLVRNFVAGSGSLKLPQIHTFPRSASAWPCHVGLQLIIPALIPSSIACSILEVSL